MQAESFFPGAARRIVLGSPTLQTSNRRICIPIAMPLSGESVVGMPDWLGLAYEQVSKNFTELTPEIEQIVDLTLAFENNKPSGKLFEAPSAKAPAAELRRFVVQRVGDQEDPEVELHFKAYIPFTRDLWVWIGEMAGSEVYIGFPKSLGAKVKAPEQRRLDDPAGGERSTVIDSTPSAAEVEALAGDSNPEPDASAPKKAKPGNKSGPKELANQVN